MDKPTSSSTVIGMETTDLYLKIRDDNRYELYQRIPDPASRAEHISLGFLTKEGFDLFKARGTRIVDNRKKPVLVSSLSEARELAAKGLLPE